MNRRHFVTHTSAAAALAFIFRNNLFAQPTPPTPGPLPAPLPRPAQEVKTEFRPLRRDVGIFSGRGGTIGWLSSAAALAVVDTQFPETAKVCLDGLPNRGVRQIDVVINTHHHGDHTGGNAVFRPVAKSLVAHENVPGLQRAVAARANPPGADPVVAENVFGESWRQNLGDEVVSARYFGPAHTKGDIVVMFEKANVVHLGDLMFNRRYPVIDRLGGASIENWIRVLEKVAKDYPADAIYIFGHGKDSFGVTGKREDLLVFRDYLVELLTHTRKEISAGKSKAEIATLENLPGFPDFHEPRPNRLSSNLGTAFDELTKAEIKG